MLIHTFRFASPVVKQLVVPAFKKTDPTKLTPASVRSFSSNPEALATKDQLHRVELGLSKEISSVREGLTKEISGVREGLTKEISGVREGLTKEISNVESRLSERLTKEISGVREGLTKEISGVREGLTKEISNVESRLSEKTNKAYSDILVAIEKQNVKFEQTGARQEKFEKKVYGMIVAGITACIGYVERNRLYALVSTATKTN